MKRHKDYWSDMFTIFGWEFMIIMYIITNTPVIWEPINVFYNDDNQLKGK
jgi:hypothetical protein